MLVGDKYKVESDGLNVTVFEKAKPKKPGTVNWRAVAYLSTLKNALEYLVDLEVLKTGLKDFSTVVKKQDELYRLIASLKLPETA